MKRLSIIIICVIFVSCFVVGCKNSPEASNSSTVKNNSNNYEINNSSTINENASFINEDFAYNNLSSDDVFVSQEANNQSNLPATGNQNSNQYELPSWTATQSEQTNSNDNEYQLADLDDNQEVALSIEDNQEVASNTEDNQNEIVNITLGQDALHRYRNSNDIGSSRNLNGKILVYCFFVADNESSWKAEECDKFLSEQIQPALDFILDGAKQWNVDLSFEVKSYCDEREQFSLKYNGTVNKDLMVGDSTKDIFNQMAINMGYLSDRDFIAKDNASNNHNDSVYLTIINKKGRSYTRRAYFEDDTYYTYDDHPEHCVIFAQDIDSFSSTLSLKERSATIAHEILHPFGAEDYYKSERLALAQQYYYYDIMTLSTRNISRLKIMDMTAFSLGWSDVIPELCYNSVWVGGRFEIQ